MMNILEERSFPINELRLLASPRSVGKKLTFKGEEIEVKLADENEHIKYTGVSNKKILENLEILRKSGKPFILRTPLRDIAYTKKGTRKIIKLVFPALNICNNSDKAKPQTYIGLKLFVVIASNVACFSLSRFSL